MCEQGENRPGSEILNDFTNLFKRLDEIISDFERRISALEEANKQ